MANTFSQHCVHIVFSVKYRDALISPVWEKILHQYMNGILKKIGVKPLIINGIQDHVHVLIELPPDKAVSDVVRELKKKSSEFVNDQELSRIKFQWQTGFAVFAVSHSAVPRVIKYIANQREHHKNYTFKNEYINLLKQAEIQFDLKYVFDLLDDADE